MKNSFVELNVRERVNTLLDNGRELIDLFDQIITPSLPARGIVPEGDDGITVNRGTTNGKQAMVVAVEGKSQGGGIGEASGAKIVAALEHILEENKRGNGIFPVIVLDTGGVHLQEANYGLPSISEIGNVIITLRQYVLVIGLIPGRAGSFGDMSITSALMGCLIVAKKARVGLNGSEATEQETGVWEFDSNDKDLTWNILGSRQQVESKIIDKLATDSVEAIKAAVVAAMDRRKDTHRSESSAFYLPLLDSLDLSKPMTIGDYNEVIANHQAKSIDLPEVAEGDEPAVASVGYDWFAVLSGMKSPTSSISTVYYGKPSKFIEEAIVTSIVPDPKDPIYRVWNGEIGLVEGFRIGQVLNHVCEEDKGKKVKRPIIIVIDVSSRAHDYNEELIGIHMALVNSIAIYAKLRQAGYPVTGLITGNAISGAFLTHRLQSSRLITLNDREITVQAMSEKSATRVTKRLVAGIETATEKAPAITYDINNYAKLGAIYHFPEDIIDQATSEQNVGKIIEAIGEVTQDIRNTNDMMLMNRYTNETAKTFGRVETNKVRAKMDGGWGA